MVLSSGNRVKAEQVGSHGNMEEQEEERDYEEGDFSKSIEAGVQVRQVHMYIRTCTCTCCTLLYTYVCDMSTRC